ncbi:MAG: 4Fe-4S binding protein, partial [Planctomycetota bacterium]|nr:4Fe-4S binding protein [Planctomycetota bacterium]
VEKTIGWQRSLLGHNIFQDEDLAGVDTVTGATRTSAAILSALRLAGKRFAAYALGRGAGDGPLAAATSPWSAAASLLAAVVAAAVLRFSAHRALRWLFCGAVIIGLGWWANQQFASYHAVLLLRGDSGAGLAVFFALAVAAAVIFCGNLYCGYVCPFGALQDIVAWLSPAAWRAEPEKNIYGPARLGKYVFLFLLAAAALGWSDVRTDADPLTTFWSGAAPSALAIAALALSLFYRRFWCRTLCPAGAFLSLLASAALARRLFPQPAAARCDLGVQQEGEVDCILCDRCRFAPPPAAPKMPAQARAIFFLLSLLFLGATLGRAMFILPVAQPTPPAASASAPTAAPMAGQPRKIDAEVFRRLLDEGQLADHPAEYQRPLPAESE